MKICVLGAGALGCSIGGVLAEGGSEVFLVDRFQAHVAAMNSVGLRVRVGDFERIVKVRSMSRRPVPSASTQC